VFGAVHADQLKLIASSGFNLQAQKPRRALFLAAILRRLFQMENDMGERFS